MGSEKRRGDDQSLLRQGNVRLRGEGLTDRTRLAPLGWDAAFETALGALLATPELSGHPRDAWIVGRVIGEEREHYRVQLDAANDQWIWGEVIGRIRHDARTRRDFPAVGDWVVGVPVGDGLSIHALVPRRTVLVRKAAGDSDDEQVLAANVDTALVMSSLNAELNPRRLERFLTLVWDGGVRPVVLLSKADLVPDATVLATVRKTVADVAPDVSVHELSVREGHGLEALDAYFGPGQTAVLLGSSGVGKSTLVNHLLGREATRTQDIREHDQKGKHTTTSRNLFRLPGGALLIDTPGMRELQMLDHEEGLAALFPEIEALILACRFNDCGHVSEPGCAIKVALADGSLPADRWAARNKLDAEIAARERRDDKALSSREKRRYKKAEKEMKANFKQKKWDQ